MTVLADEWIDVGGVSDVPLRGSRIVRSPDGDIAIFRAADGVVFSLRDRCPHRGGPLSQGIVHGRSVTCPLHNWVIDLDSGAAMGADHGCANVVSLKVQDGRILMNARHLSVTFA